MPPDILIVAEPLDKLHVAAVTEEVKLTELGWVTPIVCDITHPLKSVMSHV